MALSAGTRLGSFEVIGLLGVGGMGEVYRARDTKLGREVAIKVLPPEFAEDHERLQRFEREARLLAALDHPNIGALYDFQHVDGTHFLVMQLVEGETLAERLDRGRIPIDEAIPIFVQIAEALEAAHEAGIVHRDLKPGNVKVTPDDTVKVLDFGLAKSLAGSDSDPLVVPRASSPDATTLPGTPTPPMSITGSEMIVGTPSYMSPEQARGKSVDKRSDVWAFGCCLYQALTGAKPFKGDTIADTISSITRDEPNWGALPPETPYDVRRIVERCMEKDPKRRLSSMNDIAVALRDAEREPSPARGAAANGLRGRRLSPIVAAAVALLIGVALTYGLLRGGSSGIPGAGAPADEGKITSLAVLPLDNLMNDPEQDYFVDAMTEAITAELSKISSLKVISRTSAMRFRNTDMAAPEIAEELGVKGLIEGSVLRDGNEVKITVQLIDGPADAHMWANSYEGTLEDIFKLHSDVALAIAEEIRATLSPEEESRIAYAPKVDLEAYDLYLRGLETYADGTLEGSMRAIRYFEEALEIEPDFALAWGRKSFAHTVIAIFVPPAFTVQSRLAEEAADKAIALAPDEAGAYYAKFIVELSSLDWYAAKETADRAYQLNPNLAEINLAVAQVEALRGNLSESQIYFERAYELDSHSTFIVPLVAIFLAFTGSSERSIQMFESFIAEDPDFPLTHILYAVVLTGADRYDESLRAIDEFERLSGNPAISKVVRAIILAADGRLEDELALEIEMLSKGTPSAVSPDVLAMYYGSVGEFDRALDYISQAMEAPTSNLVSVLRLYPFSTGSSVGKFHELPENDRYWELIDRTNFPPFPEGHPGYERQQAWLRKQAAAEALARQPKPVRRYTINLPQDEPLAPDLYFEYSPMLFTPDGKTILYTADPGGGTVVVARALDELKPRRIRGTKGGRFPVVSPDGRRISFHAKDGYWQVPIIGGRPRKIVDSQPRFAAVWIDDKTVVPASLQLAQGLQKVNVETGERTPVIPIDPVPGTALQIPFPHIPGTDVVLYVSSRGPAVEDLDVYAVHVETGETARLVKGAVGPQYAASGHLLYAQPGQLMAVAFDPESLQTRGPAFDVTEPGMASDTSTPLSFGLSQDGTLVYVPASPSSSDFGLYQRNVLPNVRNLVWVDMQGNEEPWPVHGIAPDFARIGTTAEGTSIAIRNSDGGELWIFDPSGRSGSRRLTFEGPHINAPDWGKDGRTLYYSALRDGVWHLIGKDTLGLGAERVILRADSPGWESWQDFKATDYSSRMGTILGWTFRTDVGRADLLIVSEENPAEPRGFFSPDYNALNPALSPDEKWLAYQTDQFGGYEIFVTTFPELEGTRQISPAGGTQPVWAPDGSAIYYRDDAVGSKNSA